MVEIHLNGQLESVTLIDPFQATVTNMTAALRNGSAFFMGTNPNGQLEAVNCGYITRITDLGGDA